MTQFLIRRFVKDYENTEEMSVRTAYGVLASVVGIFCNILLAAVKMLIGITMHSVSVTADAINNLSDAGSSVLGLIGVKIAEMPADENHPFGHGRMEYITALVVSFLVIDVGLTFLKESVDKIMHPEEITFHALSVIVLILSVGVKFWLGRFNGALGKKIDSKVMMATAADSMGDVFTSTATIASILFWKITGWNVDGFVGVLVSLLVMKAGFEIAMDTLEPLLGAATSAEDYNRIKEFVEKYDGIIGSHDLIVHNYGPGRSFASIHAEVPNDVDIEESHEIIDKIEREAVKELGILLVIHMDPLETKNDEVLGARKDVEDVVEMIDSRCSIHDFRMVDGKNQINLIFDLVVPREYSEEKIRSLVNNTKEELCKVNHKYRCVIHAEKSFVEEVQ